MCTSTFTLAVHPALQTCTRVQQQCCHERTCVSTSFCLIDGLVFSEKAVVLFNYSTGCASPMHTSACCSYITPPSSDATPSLQQGGVRAVQRLCVCMCTPLYRNHMLVYCICIVFFFVFFLVPFCTLRFKRTREICPCKCCVHILLCFPLRIAFGSSSFLLLCFQSSYNPCSVSFSSLSPPFPPPFCR